MGFNWAFKGLIVFCRHESFKTEGGNVDSSVSDNINITRLLKAISVSLFNLCYGHLQRGILPWLWNWSITDCVL